MSLQFTEQSAVPFDDECNEIKCDKSTDLIVAGYIKKAETVLSSPLNVIPKELFSIISSYTSDTYNGIYEWKIDKDLMYKMFMAKPKKKFSSPLFEIAGIKWQICAYPNGSNYKDLGSFKLFISPILVPFAPNWNKIISFAGFYCPQTYSGDTTIFTFHRKNALKDRQYKFYQSKHGLMLLDDIKYRSANQLTIKINIQILKIFCNSDNFVYENNILSINKMAIKQIFSWRIHSELMTEMKYSYLRKCFISII
eukprot:361995_1